MARILIIALVWVGTVVGALFVGSNFLAEPRTVRDVEFRDYEQGERGSSDPLAIADGDDSAAGPARGAVRELNPDDPLRFEGDASEFVRLAIASEDPLDRMYNLALALKNLTPETLPAVLAEYENLPNDRSSFQAYAMLMAAWGAFDGAGAIEYARNSEMGRGAEFMSTIAMRTWAQNDPGSVVSWLDTQESIDARMVQSMINGWAATDLDAARRYAENLPAGDERNQALGSLARSFAEQDPLAAISWAEGYADIDAQEARRLSNQITNEWIRNDPEAASAYVAEQIETTGEATGTRNMTMNWAMRDPEAAGEWAASLPAGEARSDAMVGLVQSWARTDPVAAGEYLNQFPSSPEYDGAFSTYARTNARTDPANSMSWALSISDDNVRRDTVVSVARQYARVDPQGYQEYLASPAGADLPADINELVRVPETGQGGGGGPRGGRGGRGGFGQ